MPYRAPIRRYNDRLRALEHCEAAGDVAGAARCCRQLELMARRKAALGRLKSSVQARWSRLEAEWAVRAECLEILRDEASAGGEV